MRCSGHALIHPISVLERAGLRSGCFAADFGCGSLGHFSFAAADVVGGEGRVYAVDVLPFALQRVQRTAKVDQYWHVHPIHADVERYGRTPIPETSLDMIIVANTLHLAHDRAQMIREALRLLKPSGRLLLVEWKNEPTVLGPPLSLRLHAGDIASHLAESTILIDEFEAGDHHDAWVYQRM